MPHPEFIILQETDSTNRYAHELLNQKDIIEHGTAIMSFYQTAGKGQKSNHWESERGANLLLSVVLRIDFLNPSSLVRFNQAVAISVCDYLEEWCNVIFKVKWPNDIMFGDHKIAGILIENSIRGKTCSNSIVGIGVNLNQLTFQDYLPKATSIRHITNTSVDSIESFALGLREKLLEKIEILKNGGGRDIEFTYNQKLFGLHETRWFDSDGHSFKGHITGVDHNGLLTLSTDSGELKFGLKEVKYLFDK
jgi:BirA family biotin operon repressor/biotin-[acetyl-CoA-carboxylase] ligase